MKNIILFSMLIFFQLYGVAVMPAFGMERQMEALDRGLVAVKTKDGVFISWRVLGDEKEVAFNVYKNGKLIRYISSSQATNMTDETGKMDDR